MKIIERWRVGLAAAVAAGAALALAACMVSPGKLQSTLDLRRDGTFTFTYDGQIYLLALSRLADMANEEEASDDFVESTCWDDESYEERPCTEEEIAQQRETWEQDRESRRANAEREAEQMRQMLGGIDPADPKAAEELAERLRRQEGWKRVEYRRDGLFEVEFSLASRIGHDFSFPTFERFPMMNSFVVANVRQGGTVRVEATGFAPQAGGNPFQAMMGGMTGLETTTRGEESELPPIPEMDGTFRIVTDGQILANTTDEGPQAGPTGQVLEWKVNRRTQSAPMALIQLGN
jgi:hypothetical protein